MTLAVARITQPESAWLTRVTAVCCLFGAQAIHTAVIQEHIDEWLPVGLFFLVLSLFEGLLAVALITAPFRWVERLAIGVSLGTVVLWLFTRTLGLPIGPIVGRAEPIGRADTIAGMLELITALALIATATATTETRRSALDYLRAAVIVSAVVALTAFGYSQAA